MAAPVRSSTLKYALAVSTGNAALENTISSGAAGNATIAVVTASKDVSSGDLVSAVSGHTLAVRSKYVLNGNTVETSIWYNDNISAGPQTATLTLVNATTDVTWHFDEFAGLTTTSPLDKFATGAAASNSDTVGTTSTTTLAQASELVIVAAANRWNYRWGSTFGDPQPPSPYTKLQGIDDNGIALPMISGRLDVSSTNGVSVTFSQINQGDNGASAALATFKYASTTKKVRIKFDTAAAATSGWTVYVWRGDPNSMSAEVKATNITIGAGGITDIDAGTLADLANTTAVNVVAYQPSGSKGVSFGPGSIVSV